MLNDKHHHPLYYRRDPNPDVAGITFRDTEPLSVVLPMIHNDRMNPQARLPLHIERIDDDECSAEDQLGVSKIFACLERLDLKNIRVGFMEVVFLQDGRPDCPVAYVQALETSTEGMGIGTFLMSYLEIERPFDIKSIWILTPGPASFSFYSQLGFEKDSSGDMFKNLV